MALWRPCAIPGVRLSPHMQPFSIAAALSQLFTDETSLKTWWLLPSVAQCVLRCVAVDGGESALQVAHNYLRQDQLFHRVLHLPVAVAAVSDAVQSILAQQFGRSSLLIPNGVDCDRFFPGPPTDVAPTAILSSPTKAQVGWIPTDLAAPIKVVTLNSNHYGARCSKRFPGLSSTLLMSSQDYRSR